MSNGSKFDKPGIYRIKVKGALDWNWSDWVDIRYEADDWWAWCVITLHGMLGKDAIPGPALVDGAAD